MMHVHLGRAVSSLAAIALGALLLAPCQPAQASELIYTPVNPSFGGNPLNGQVLLNEAQAQKNERSTSSGYTSPSTIDNFESSLVSQVLARMASNIADQALGTSGKNDIAGGSYDFGEYHIQVNNGLSSISVSIQNSLTGQSTTVEVPRLTGGNN